MPLRQRLENLPVGQKLLAALLVLLTTVLLVANLTFISAAYWISQESMAPQALQSIGRLVSNPALAAEALESPTKAEALLNELTSYSPLRAAALYDGEGNRLATACTCRTTTAISKPGASLNFAATRSSPCPAATSLQGICCWWPAVSCRWRSIPAR